MRRLLLDLCLFALSALCVLGCLERCSGAPRPFARHSRSRQLCRADLVGTWHVSWTCRTRPSWGTVVCTFTLLSDGSYRCAWPGATYVGSWGLDRQGRFWITESCHPETADSWSSYAICLDPRTLCGHVGVGAAEVSIRLRKVR
jgi:hypothetical protein